VKGGRCAGWVREMSMGYEGCDGYFVGYERGKHTVNRGQHNREGAGNMNQDFSDVNRGEEYTEQSEVMSGNRQSKQIYMEICC
jgi:hypothetical protein